MIAKCTLDNLKFSLFVVESYLKELFSFIFIFVQRFFSIWNDLLFELLTEKLFCEKNFSCGTPLTKRILSLSKLIKQSPTALRCSPNHQKFLPLTNSKSSRLPHSSNEQIINHSCHRLVCHQDKHIRQDMNSRNSKTCSPSSPRSGTPGPRTQYTYQIHFYLATNWLFK